MQRRKLTRRPVLAGLGAFGAASLVLASLAPSGAAAKAKAQGVNLAALAKAVNQAAAQPSFSTYAAGYGAPVKDVKKLKGMKLLIVPGDSQLAACAEIAQADQALASAVGVDAKIFSTTGQVSELSTAVSDAIHEGYNAIDFECDFNPELIAPSIAQALAHHVAVVSYGATPAEVQVTHEDANTVDPWAFDSKIAVDQAVVQHHGKPFHALGIYSNVNPLFEPALVSELHRTCPRCTLTNIEVPVPQWATNLTSAVTSALLKDPSITVLFPHYAGMLAPMVAGIEAAHRTATVKSYLAFGGGTPEMQQQAAGAGHEIIQSDIGGYPVWTGYLLFVQTAKVLTHMAPIPEATAYGPDRVATPQNVAEILRTGGWGTDFVNGFRHMLGLPPLSGKALFEAATLNGAMTAKV
jgi:ribose transport system substrate-binding protein